MRLVRLIRRGRGIGLRKVADDTGIDLGSLSKFEQGQRGLSEPNLIKLAKYYGIPIESILLRIEDATPEPAAKGATA